MKRILAILALIASAVALYAAAVAPTADPVHPGNYTNKELLRYIADYTQDGYVLATAPAADPVHPGNLTEKELLRYIADYTQQSGDSSSAKRVITTTDDATAVIDVTATDIYQLSAVANATTFSTTGTPVDGQQIMIRIKDAGTAKGLTWDAAFVAIGVTLPTTTTAGKWTYVGAAYNSAAAKFHVLAVTTES